MLRLDDARQNKILEKSIFKEQVNKVIFFINKTYSQSRNFTQQTIKLQQYKIKYDGTIRKN